jgi:hypothetical protein
MRSSTRSGPVAAAGRRFGWGDPSLRRRRSTTSVRFSSAWPRPGSVLPLGRWVIRSTMRSRRRMLNDAEVRARRVPHCREHRRLLGRGAEQGHSLCRKEWRFIGVSSPSSLTSTDSRAGQIGDRNDHPLRTGRSVGIGVLWLGTILRSSSSSNAASSSDSAVCNPASADRDSRC